MRSECVYSEILHILIVLTNMSNVPHEVCSKVFELVESLVIYKSKNEIKKCGKEFCNVKIFEFSFHLQK